jgi:hypothetical protein
VAVSFSQLQARQRLRSLPGAVTAVLVWSVSCCEACVGRLLAWRWCAVALPEPVWCECEWRFVDVEPLCELTPAMRASLLSDMNRRVATMTWSVCTGGFCDRVVSLAPEKSLAQHVR